LFAAPKHPYTRALLAAVPQLPGVIAAPAAPAAPAVPVLPAEPIQQARLMASGCAYRDRCPFVLPLCETTEPPLIEVGTGHWAACHRSQETLIPLSFAS
jgi:oligopeptide/dipeptide ABC transporter ATP-binding protein